YDVASIHVGPAKQSLSGDEKPRDIVIQRKGSLQERARSEQRKHEPDRRSTYDHGAVGSSAS
ncbi:MAG: hypothetical protein VCE43_03910, partial [Myxococcota bacterium]